MPVDDRTFAACAAAIAETSHRRVDRLQRELAEQQAAARARGRGHLQRMVELGLHDRSWEEAPTATGAPKRTRALDPLGDDESFSDRHWLH
ncbi:MAG: hypothetical protein M3291_04920 [Actinomycetota bacterium]|nr:hypothetical protein [Actinomycetota bacterium]